MIGAQEPRIRSVPAFSSSLGREAVDLAASAGLKLDPWQTMVLEGALGRRDDDRWAAFEVGIDVPRQNGKGAILEARELAGLFLLDERMIIHSAHQFDTSLEAFRRLLFLIEETPELSRKVKRVSMSHGEEGIELHTRQRIRFRTRTKGGGRGFSCDCLILDEAMFFQEAAHGALLPTLSARPNPQVWYAGSAVDQRVHDDGVVWARVRERGIAGDDPRLAYFEWSVDHNSPSDLDDRMAKDESAWAAANPGLGIRVDREIVENEQRSMDARTFAVERLGVGDWPRTDGQVDSVIPLDIWLGLTDADSRLEGEVAFAFDVSPDRAFASVAAACRRPDGLMHIEIVDRRRGTSWLPDRLLELCEGHDTDAVICDAIGPAASLLQDLDDLPVEVTTVSSREHANACGHLFDLVDDQAIRHHGSPEMTAAVKNATSRPLGDAWAWSRKNSQVDISPLVAVTLALWAAADLDEGAGGTYVLDTRVAA